MRIIRMGVLALLAVFGVVGFGTELGAQQLTSATTMFVPVTGTASTGVPFTGTFFIKRFDAQNAGTAIAAVGTLNGTLNGGNVVTPVAVPVTVTPAVTVPAATSAIATAPATCTSVHVQLAPSALAVLGSGVMLDGTSFDIAVPQTTAPAVITGVTSAVQPVPLAPPPFTPPQIQTGTAVPTSPVGSITAGVISPAPQTPAAPVVTPSAQPLASALCTLSTLTQSTSSATQIATSMNQVLVMLGQ